MIVLWLLCSLLTQSNPEITSAASDVYLESFTDGTEMTYSRLEVNDIQTFGNSSDEIVSFVIVLQEGLYNAVGADLMEYWAEVILSEGNFNRVKIVEINYAEPIEIRAYFQRLYMNWGLEGVVLVGDIPYAEWEGTCDYPDPDGIDGYDYHYFASDYYYSDINNNISMWQDTKTWTGEQWVSGSNGRYDFVDPFAGDAIFPDIYCGRICLSKTTAFYIDSPYGGSIKDETSLLQDYLRRSIEFRVNPPSLPHRAMLYVSNYDDWWDSGDTTWDKMFASLRYVFEESEILWNQREDSGHEQYMAWLSYGCEWMYLRCHANNNDHSWENTQSTQSNSLIPGVHRETIPKARFITLDCCYNGNFTAQNNMGSVYLLCSEWACGVVAQTGEGWGLAGHHASDGGPFYSAISDGKTVGFAFRKMCQERNITGTYGFAWDAMIKMIYLGDPSIMPEMHYTALPTDSENRRI